MQESNCTLILCEKFNCHDPERSCRYGSKCRWVHACTDRATRKYIHLNWLWRSREECTYKLMPEGRSFRILRSRTPFGFDIVDSGLVVQTRCVFTDVDRPASHCAHFYYGRECHLGALCDFAHVINVDHPLLCEQAPRSQEATPPLWLTTKHTTMPSPSPHHPHHRVISQDMQSYTESDHSSTCLQAEVSTEPSGDGEGRWQYNPYAS